jgi:methyl-accepting chemotaxis protein
VSNVSYPSVTDRVMVFGTPVEDNEGHVLVVEATVKSRLEKLYQPTLNRSTSIVNASGNVIIGGTTGDRGQDGEFAVNQSAVAAALNGKTTYTAGDQYVYAYSPVNTDRDDPVDPDESPRLVAVTTTPVESAFSLQRTVTRSLIFVLAVSLLVLGAFGATVGYQTIRPLSALRHRAQQMERGDLDVDLHTPREDEIGRLYDSFAAMRDSLKDRIREAQQAREQAETARDRVERLNDHLQHKANTYRRTMQACAEGDLTRRLDPDSDAASMTAIADAFNAMLDDIEATVGQVKAFAGEVATESQEVTASAQEVRNASQQVTESIQEISDGAVDQDRRLEAVSQEMASLSTTTQQIASSSNEVAQLADQTAQTGREGRDAAQDAAQGMAEIRERSAAIVEATERLDAEMDGVDELLEFIAGVAKETNMLALNANIEASRGTEGEASGFGAVADQVKQFAEETQEATDEIEQRLERIQTQSETTVREVREANDRIEANTDSIERAIDALDDVAEYAQETNDGIQEISAATQQQASSVQQVVAMVEEVATISTRTADEAGTVASAAQQQTAGMSDVSESASDLARRASELSEVLDRFTTDDTPQPGEETTDADTDTDAMPTDAEPGDE